MRKFYFLAFFIAFLNANAQSQDTANFNYTVGQNNQVFFTNTSHLHGDAPKKAIWLFGDGIRQGTSPLANVFHQYSAAGTYTVCLKIYKYSASSNDSVITAEFCKTLTLTNNTSPDSCRTEFTNSTSTAGSLTQLFIAKPWHNLDKKPEQICWKFGDNQDTCIKYDPNLSNNYAINHYYSKTGQYNVCIRVQYQGGCVSEYCRVINVPGDLCKVDYTMAPVTASPLSRRFTAQPWHVQQKKPVRVCWDFGDGSTECKLYQASYSEPYAVNHAYAKAGQYNVCVSILYDGGCESKKCKIITIESPPPADSCFVDVFEVATNSNNLERHFYASSMQDRRLEKICWIFGDGKDTCLSVSSPLTPQSLVVSHRYPAPGVYPICVKVKYANGCEAHKCREVVIRSATNICGGYIIDSLVDRRTFAFKGFTIQNQNDRVVTWRWTFGDGGSSNDRNVNHTYKTAGKFEVCLYIKTELGCETRICKYVTVQGENKPILQLAPNPVITTLHAVFLSIIQEPVTINIYNANGILIKTYTRIAIKGTNTWEFDVAALPTGIYSVIIFSPHQLANAIFFKR